MTPSSRTPTNSAVGLLERLLGDGHRTQVRFEPLPIFVAGQSVRPGKKRVLPRARLHLHIECDRVAQQQHVPHLLAFLSKRLDSDEHSAIGFRLEEVRPKLALT